MTMFEVELFRVKLSDNEWIEISRYEMEEDHRKLLSALGKSAKATSPTNVDFGLDLGATRSITLESRIKNWSFRDSEGNPISVAPEAISKLPRKITDKVMEAINKLEEEDFLAPKKETD